MSGDYSERDALTKPRPDSAAAVGNVRRVIQPPRREDFQPSYASDAFPNDGTAANGWYGSMVNTIGRRLARACPGHILSDAGKHILTFERKLHGHHWISSRLLLLP